MTEVLARKVTPERVCKTLEMLATWSDLGPLGHCTVISDPLADLVYKFCHVAGATTCHHPEWTDHFLRVENEVYETCKAPRPPQSLIIFKPDSIERRLFCYLLTVLEAKFRLKVLRWQTMDRALCEEHYWDHVQKDFYPRLEEAMCDKPLVAAVFEGNINEIRNCVMGLRAEWKEGTEIGPRNLLHASDSQEAAEREIALWFPNL